MNISIQFGYRPLRVVRTMRAFSAGSIKDMLVKQGLLPQEQPQQGDRTISRTPSEPTRLAGNPKLRFSMVLLVLHLNTQNYQPRAEQFARILAAERIDMQQLRGMAYHGVPDGSDTASLAPNLRQTVWKV